MLVLSRRKNQSIMIGEKIEIVVVDVQDGKVKLGIKAPKDIDVVRKELYNSVLEENKKAADSKINIEELKKLFKSE